jgi:hypothetical protein
MSSVRHAGFSDYLLRSRLDAGSPRADGSWVLIFDATLRIAFHPAPRGDLVLEGQIAELSAARHSADRMLETVLETAARKPAHDAGCLVLATGGHRLMLQQRVAADASGEEFEHSLGGFLDTLTAWRAQLGTI